MNPKRSLKLAFAALLVVVGIALGACGDKATEPFRDAARGQSNNEPADVMTFPDGFSNVAAKCDGTTRVYVAFKADQNRASIAVSPNHPKCGGRG